MVIIVLPEMRVMANPASGELGSAWLSPHAGSPTQLRNSTANLMMDEEDAARLQ